MFDSVQIDIAQYFANSCCNLGTQTSFLS